MAFIRLCLATATALAAWPLFAQVNIDEMKQAEAAETAETVRPVDDRTLADRVRSALLREPGVEALKIDVESKTGHVVLEGNVGSPQERSSAGRAAERVQGVQSVTNNLAVSGSASTGR